MIEYIRYTLHISFQYKTIPLLCKNLEIMTTIIAHTFLFKTYLQFIMLLTELSSNYDQQDHPINYTLNINGSQWLGQDGIFYVFHNKNSRVEKEKFIFKISQTVDENNKDEIKRKKHQHHNEKKRKSTNSTTQQKQNKNK